MGLCVLLALRPALPAANQTAGSHGPVIDGDTFTVRTISDQQQGGMTVCAFSVPATWKFTSQVDWNYARINCPVTVTAQAVNPTNSEAYFLFPPLQYFCLNPDVNLYSLGQNVSGFMYSHQPSPPDPTLGGLVYWARGKQKKFAYVGAKELPGLPAALGLPAAPNQTGVGIRVTYELNGQPTEEEFYAVYYKTAIPFDGPQGRTFQINWGLMSVHSFRAPAGTLDKRRPVFAALSKSYRPNPAWKQRDEAINAYIAQVFNAQTQAGYDTINAAVQVSKIISANNDAMIASIDRQLAASNRPVSSGGGRGPTASFDDYIRGVDTVQDPYYGASQHSYNEQFHWTDGYGSYRHTNDPTYNPNQTEIGNWQLMPGMR